MEVNITNKNEKREKVIWLQFEALKSEFNIPLSNIKTLAFSPIFALHKK
jgi:hypothetical protein